MSKWFCLQAQYKAVWAVEVRKGRTGIVRMKRERRGCGVKERENTKREALCPMGKEGYEELFLKEEERGWREKGKRGERGRRGGGREGLYICCWVHQQGSDSSKFF
jgi:hypothetical protein